MKIAVLGGGSFGTVVANLVAENGHLFHFGRGMGHSNINAKGKGESTIPPKPSLHDNFRHL